MNNLIWCLNHQPFRAYAIGMLFNGKHFTIMQATREDNARGLTISLSKMLEIQSNINIIANVLTAYPTTFGHCGPHNVDKFLGEGMTSFVFKVKNAPQVLKVFKTSFLEERYTVDDKYIKENEIEALSIHLPQAARDAKWQLAVVGDDITKIPLDASSLPPRQELVKVDGNSIYTTPVCRAIHRGTFQEAEVKLLNVALDVMNVLYMLHQAGYVHSDITRHNVMLSENRAVIVDYGLIRNIGGRQGLVRRDLMKFCATIMYWFTGGEVLRSDDFPTNIEECETKPRKDWVAAFKAAYMEDQLALTREIFRIVKDQGVSTQLSSGIVFSGRAVEREKRQAVHC